jgi:hypothetical protein
MKPIFTSLMYLILAVSIDQAAIPLNVEFRNQDKDKKIEVYIDGKFFTAFIYPTDMEKQSLYPIFSASGKLITRGYPLNPRPYDRTDHAHHVGLWLNFGDVNGLDFWNNSFAVKPADKPNFGTIKFKRVIFEDPSKGELVVSSEWVDFINTVLLNEETTFIFFGSADLRTIERTSKLTAVQQVTFNENKEGLIGLRLDRAFEEPATKPGKFLDAAGNVTDVPVLNNDGVNGVYRNAEGTKGSDVWGKRSPWVAMRAEKEGEVITIVIIDNPRNPNYPAWSHARGYGLFAANNIGGRAFDNNAWPVKIVLNPGETVTFSHKIVIGGDLSDAEINHISGEFK